MTPSESEQLHTVKSRRNFTETLRKIVTIHRRSTSPYFYGEIGLLRKGMEGIGMLHILSDDDTMWMHWGA